MAPVTTGRAPGICLPLVACTLALAAGCAERDPFNLGKAAPVRGHVTVGGAPLHTGIITFIPDASRGNMSPHQPSANVGKDGTYALFTVGKTAAPLAWYKIVVQAYETDADLRKRAKSPGEEGLYAKSIVNAKYESPKKTPLSVEVVEGAADGAYDLKLSK